ncbi:hypothetical protein CGMCC3_g12967 [Colletotrichum fructicola]|uniref:DUF7492 domain-containing protein n=2 Tax=Colletotrichum fructicola (strain Nara gc5) TaxID=1213859 RepID=A0A7J6IHM3_COLFN|nr:uncharacterized protein CGMCC3_g12967 [Colletotrichum fructicola]KAE9570948.1 hypothetical protein CGMCC3_g12967 [Colletotrichum fructicola]KAF4475544.1 hypothetical protein CGGC5_v015980 [Colletotrichum fructicola Nara gc5]
MLSPPGFPPRWSGRNGNFSDGLFTNLLEASNYHLCAKQPLGQQMPGFDMLKAAPGDFVGLRYQENGHITLPDSPINKPSNRGTIYVYGTLFPRAEDSLFDVFKRWTADGKGGDGRGRLLATRHYDDGQCYQVNSGPISLQRQQQFRKAAMDPQGADLWCQAVIRLPKDLAEGTLYSIYFVWTWPTLRPSSVSQSRSGKYGDFPEQGSPREAVYLTSEDVVKSEIYGSCAMIEVDSSGKVESATGETYIADQDINNLGIKEQLDNLFLV